MVKTPQRHGPHEIIAVDDILVQDILERLQKDFPDRFTLHYTVDRAPTTGTWKGSVGFISKEMIAAHGLFNSSSSSTQVFMCGPPPMIKFACVPNLKELGFTDKDLVVF
jgi:cytochrome-b5 reductase